MKQTEMYTEVYDDDGRIVKEPRQKREPKMKSDEYKPRQRKPRQTRTSKVVEYHHSNLDIWTKRAEVSARLIAKMEVWFDLELQQGDRPSDSTLSNGTMFRVEKAVVGKYGYRLKKGQYGIIFDCRVDNGIRMQVMFEYDCASGFITDEFGPEELGKLTTFQRTWVK